jgi:hypothetical protein
VDVRKRLLLLLLLLLLPLPLLPAAPLLVQL